MAKYHRKPVWIAVLLESDDASLADFNKVFPVHNGIQRQKGLYRLYCNATTSSPKYSVYINDDPWERL